ncbi:MAG: serine/threonine-protein kinase, partial [Verrucomicrobiales bacterium]
MSEERYRIEGKIGRGGIGAVYRAFDEQLGRQVAIKRVLPQEEGGEEHGASQEDVSGNLLKEAKVLSTLNHPNIVTVFDVGADAKGVFVVMELLDGETLDETIDRGVLALGDFEQVVVQSLEAMIAAQDIDLVHRDLKPSNVMVVWLPSGKFQLKILDFGLAKFSELPS